MSIREGVTRAEEGVKKKKDSKEKRHTCMVSIEILIFFATTRSDVLITKRGKGQGPFCSLLTRSVSFLSLFQTKFPVRAEKKIKE